MQYFLISSNLHNKQHKDKFLEGIELVSSSNWSKPLENVVLIRSHLSLKAIRDTLFTYLDLKDSIFIIELDPHSSWEGFNLSREVSGWFDNS